MSQKTVCDRCGKVVEENGKVRKLSIAYSSASSSDLDICPECDTAVRNLIDRLLLLKPPVAEKKPKKE